MITLLYIFLIYILLGSILYLVAENYNDKELTEFQQELFLFLGWVFKIPILIILLIDGYILPTIKQKSAIRMIKKQYNKQLKNKDLTDEERQLIIRKRDVLIDFLSNVGQSELEEDEE
jgi:DMSO reductase anchor subunit